MGRIRTACKLTLVIFALAAPGVASTQESAAGDGPSSAPAATTSEPTPLHLRARYRVSWAGVTIGRIYLNADEQLPKAGKPGSYSITIDTKTHGVATMFSSEKRIIEATGEIAQDGRLIPATYVSRPQDNDGSRVIRIRYERGLIAQQESLPPEDPSWRPPVPLPELSQIVDPATAGLIVRRMLATALSGNENQLAIRTYDGARLTDMRLAILRDEARVEVNGTYQPAVQTVITRQPVAGYTPKELKKINGGDPPVRFYFSADPLHIPLMVTADSGFGLITASFDKFEP